jgi:hypothetical protein
MDELEVHNWSDADWREYEIWLEMFLRVISSRSDADDAVDDQRVPAGVTVH